MNKGLLGVSATFLSVVAACTSNTSNTSNTNTSSEPANGSPSQASAPTPASAPAVEVTARAPVAFVQTTMPDASCRIRPAGQTAATGFALADGRGIARFSGAPASWGTQLTLDCTSPHDGRTASYAADLTDPAIFTPQAPLPSTIRPALAGDPLSYTHDQLVAAGYPPRPAREDSSYDSWLKAVSSETTIVDPAPVARLDRFAGGTFTTSSNWDGIVLQQPGVRYELATATMITPGFCENSPLCFGNAVEWTGLGGFNGDRALIQDGYYMLFNGFITEYLPFIEYWPEVSEEYVNLSLSQGQTLFASCWESNAEGARIEGGGYGGFYLHNLSTGQATPVMLIQNNGQAFAGNTADFIMETQDALLVDYGFTSMTGAGYDTNTRMHDYITDNYWEVWTEDSSGQVMQWADPSGTDTTNFYWQSGE